MELSRDGGVIEGKSCGIRLFTNFTPFLAKNFIKINTLQGARLCPPGKFGFSKGSETAELHT